MTELNKLTTEELIKEYNLTGNGDILNYIFNDFKGYIYHKIRLYNLVKYKDLAYAYSYENIWDSLKRYKPNKKQADNYIKLIIDRALKTLMTDLNTGKSLINRNASSMDYSITDEEGRSQEYHDFIGDENLNPEVIILDKIETKRKINELINQLTNLEYKVFKAYVDTFNTKGNHEEIMKLTKIHKKGIDNALQRIKLNKRLACGN